MCREHACRRRWQAHFFMALDIYTAVKIKCVHPPALPGGVRVGD